MFAQGVFEGLGVLCIDFIHIPGELVTWQLLAG